MVKYWGKATNIKNIHKISYSHNNCVLRKSYFDFKVICWKVTYAILLSFLECIIIFNYRISFHVISRISSSPGQCWRLECKLKEQQFRLKIRRSSITVVMIVWHKEFVVRRTSVGHEVHPGSLGKDLLSSLPALTYVVSGLHHWQDWEVGMKRISIMKYMIKHPCRACVPAFTTGCKHDANTWWLKSSTVLRTW